MADRTLIPGNWRADGARPFLHRTVVFVTGQGDELATPFAGCTGGCQQGRGACDCDTELVCTVAPDADRVIAQILLSFQSIMQESSAGHCEVGQRLASRFGFGGPMQQAIGQA